MNMISFPGEIQEQQLYKIEDNLSWVSRVRSSGKLVSTCLVIRNNSSPSIGVLQKTNVIYQFKCPLGDCISDNNNIYIGLTSTTLSRRLTMHLSNTTSIAQHLKKHSFPTELRKILTDNTTILEHQNNKQTYRFSKHYILETCNRHLTELIFKPVLMYLNACSYWHYL